MRLPTLRRIVQVSVFALMFLIPIANNYEFYAITGTFYAINIGGLGIADPSAIMQSIFAAGKVTIPLLKAALFPIILALLFGRIWCGWMCPYHLISDIVAKTRAGANSFRGKPIENRIPVNHSLSANLSRMAFLVVGAAVAGAVGIPILNYVNAPGIISTESMILVKQGFVSIEAVFILSLIVLELTALPRFWCRLFCPTGAVVSLFRTGFTMRLANSAKAPGKPCCEANYCSSVCPMGLQPFREGGDLLCTNCGLCIDACKSHRLRYAGFNL